MIVVGESLIVNTIQGAISYFRQNTVKLIPQIFGNLTVAEQAELQTWLQKPENQIFIFDGYPVQAQQFPCIAVVLSSENEVSDKQVFGEIYSPWEIDDTGILASAELGLGFTTTYSCLVFAANKNLTRWLQYLVKWALMANRQYLEAQGLYNQVLHAQEFAPGPIELQQESIYAYRRIVSLTAEHIDTFVLEETAIQQVITQVTSE